MKKFIDLHCHTAIGSLRDTGSTIEELVAKEKELGATAMAVTEHGTMTSVQYFRTACEEAGIKPIYGCEFYTDIGDGKRTHFIVLAKNNDGFLAISKVCSETAYNLHDGRPIATFDMFNRWFKDGIGHNNVIATSACMQGPLCRILLQNSDYDAEIEKLKKKMSKEISPESEQYKTAQEKIATAQKVLDEARAEKDKVFNLAKQPYKKVLNAAIKSGDPEQIQAAEKLKEAVETATLEKPKTKAVEAEKSKALKDLKDAFAPIFKSVEKYLKFNASIEEIEAKKVSKEQAVQETKEMLFKLQDIFGKENFFIEFQNHGIAEEIYAMPILAEIAQEYNVPVVATNDVHYAIREEAEIRHYNHVQYQNYSWSDIEPQDWELYIKTTEELSEWLNRIIPKEITEQALANTFKIAEQCDVQFEVDPKHYPKFPCKEGAKLHLRALINKGKKKVSEWTTVYQKRVEHELRVIESMGFSDYLCIVEDFLNYARLVGKIDLDDPEFLNDPYNIPKLKKLAEGRVGEGCGPGRGSAAGSLICYLVGITNIDPIKNGLLFERFLNPERVSMPDIDSDIAPDVRPFVIGYIKNKYGEKSVCQIMTISYFGAKSAIQAAARVLGKKIGDEKAFLGLSLDFSKSIEDPKALIMNLEEQLLEINSSPSAKEIIRIAKMLEGLPSGYGTHAAGIVISDNGDVSDYTPLINVSGAIDCQLDLNWVEPMGMLKLDLLGLRNLGIITDCERAVQKEYHIDLSIDSMPIEEEVFSSIFATGKTDGVFQFESDGMKKTLTNFGPESMADLTLLNAVFRPGPLQYIDDITAVKKGEKAPEYIIPEMESVLGDTYGKPVYQEQIIAIFNQFAGFTLGQADTIRRYMSKKKYEKFAAYKEKFIEGLISHEADRKAAEAFWDELLKFSEYAFNKSHACAYCAVAYATAYLKYHYPEAYACGLLNYTNTKELPKVVLSTKSQGVALKCPDINSSESTFSLHGSNVVFGLGLVPQVSASAKLIINDRNVNGKYNSFKDFLVRVNPKKNVVENLIKAGAFDAFGLRGDMLSILPDCLDILKKVKAKKAIIATDDNPGRLERAKVSKAKLMAEFDAVEAEEIKLNRIDELNDEKELLGYYISGHPMDGIKTSSVLEALPVDEKVKITALVSECDTKITKSGRIMATMQISDTTDIIDAVMFPEAYDKFGDKVEDGKIYNIYGYLKQEEDRIQFVINKLYDFKPYVKPIVLYAPDSMTPEKAEKSLCPWKDYKAGLPVDVYIKGKAHRISFPVSIPKSAKIHWL